MKNSLLRWQIAGFIFTSIAGTLLHFAYEWSGKNLWVSLISAVNESTWEHMKLLFVPMFTFAIFQSRFFEDEYPNFWCAKLTGILSGLLLIPTLFYTYTGALGVSADWFNITIFFLATALGYIVETKLLRKKSTTCVWPQVALLLLCFIALAFVAFTFVPPQIPLFENPQIPS